MLNRLRKVPSAFVNWLLATSARNGQNVGTALVQIWVNKGRAVLTMLGIIIAVASIITVVSFIEGFSKHLSTMLHGYGSSYIVVRPYWSWDRHREGLSRITLDMADIRAVRIECEDVHRISPFVYTGALVSYGRETAEDVPIRGVTEHYQTIRNFFADTGRFFGPVDIDNGAYVCVLGRSLLKLLECNESIVDDYVYINDARFRVIGLLESKGSFMGDDQDETIMIPYTTALKMFPERRDRLIFLAEATDEGAIGQAEGQISRVLRRRHDIKPGQADDFILERQDQALKEFERVRMIAGSVLAGIVSISLLVGGIGIMNVMLVSVTERTREVGLRKSVGGRRRDILLQFLTEAVVLSTVGGAIGIALGLAISYVASFHPNMIDLDVPAWSVVLALGFSAGVGIIFGVIPAFKAAIMHPIDALRHE
ncbi:MAG: ABC transporter permease [Planctomycetota bacterium]